MGSIFKLAVLGVPFVAAGCAMPGAVSAPLVHVPEMPGDQPRCKLAANQENPLVTEWPASEKANLEARLGAGALVVSYSGCTLKMLPRCQAKGHYKFRRTTTSTDVIEIRNADELFAKLPLGAVSLEGELQRSGRLAVQTTVSGQFQVDGLDVNLPRDGECQGATHVLSALSVGAFKLRSGGTARVAGKASVESVGSGGGSSSSEESLVREAGNAAQCETGSEGQPHPACASPIQMFLQALPSTIADRGAPGTIKAKFLPVRPNEKWDVVVGDRTFCTTPCERWVDPAMPYAFKFDPGFFQRSQVWEVPDLRAHLAEERVDVRLEPTNMGKLAGGVVMTTFGGIAVLTGTTLSIVGAAKGSSGVLTAGLVTLPAGIALTLPGIYFIVDSAGHVHVSPQRKGQAALLSGEF